MVNSLRQVTRLDPLKVRTDAQGAAKVVAEMKENTAAAEDAIRAAGQGECAVMRRFNRGVDCKG